MSLRPQSLPPIPEETARVARAAFPHGNIFILLRDEIGVIFADEDFTSLFASRGQPAEAPWRLALVTLFQFIEGLSDRAAADAVRSRLDWKYALSLELTDSGFDYSVLCEFRQRLLNGSAERLLFEKLLDLCRERKWLRVRGRQRTDSTHLIAVVHASNRLQCAIETLRHALNSLAVVAPEWLRVHAQPEWAERYAMRAFDHFIPSEKEERQAHAELIGTDGDELLSAVYSEDAAYWLREVPAVQTLQRVWTQQYYIEDGVVHWRTEKEGIPPARLVVSSPYDLDARLGRKRKTQWVGYKVYLTETCDDSRPHLITHVATTAAPIADGEVTPAVHRQLNVKQLLPRTHLVDTGFLDAALLVASKRDYQVDLLGPTRPDYKWQKRTATGFDASHFLINWELKEATCPEGHASSSWTPATSRGKNEVIKIKFSSTDCVSCPSRQYCTGSRQVRRTLSVRPEPQYKALQAARAREKTAAYRELYAKRAGVEGTISQGTRGFGLRRARYVGLAKTELQGLLTAMAINLVRIANWLMEVPLAQTRQSAFVKLMRQPAYS
jgi:transposase